MRLVRTAFVLVKLWVVVVANLVEVVKMQEVFKALGNPSSTW